MTTTLQKTNEEMFDEAVSYFEPKAKASKDFEKPLPDLFYNNDETRGKIKQMFDLENRSIVDLRNLQDYSFMRTCHVENADHLLDCFQDVLTHIIDEVIEQKDPVAYKLIMEKYA